MGEKFFYQFRFGKDRDIKNLYDNKLWFSNPINFNDPYDCAIQFDFANFIQKFADAFFRGTELQNVPLEKMEEQASPQDLLAIKNDIERAKENLEQMNEGLNDIVKNVFVSCFVKDYTVAPMWSYYANYHKGICVSYSEDNLNRLGCLKQVHYCNDFNKLYEELTNIYFRKWDLRDMFEYLIKYIITKAKGWSHEDEWRLIRFDCSVPNGKEGILVDTFKPSGIYIGCKASNRLIGRINKYHKITGVPIYLMKMSNKTFKLIPIELK